MENLRGKKGSLEVNRESSYQMENRIKIYRYSSVAFRCKTVEVAIEKY